MKMNNEIYPGNGACEICGETDPCRPCSGVWMQAYTPELIRGGAFWEEIFSEKDTAVDKKKINMKLASTNKP
jgi:hypothetical protein